MQPIAAGDYPIFKKIDRMGGVWYETSQFRDERGTDSGRLFLHGTMLETVKLFLNSLRRRGTDHED
jgi:hypothetical protein